MYSAFKLIGVISIIGGFVLPFTISILLSVSGNNQTMEDIIINGIIYIDPFYPLYSSTIYIAMTNSLPSDTDFK